MRTLFRRFAAIAAFGALLLAPVTTSHGSATGSGTTTVSASPVASSPTSSAAALRGTGAWQRFACLGCVAGFLFVSGTGSVAAVIAVVAAYPEVAALCAAGCYAAFAG